MKFYIGSSFKNSEIVNYMAEKLKENGWEHTYNWANTIVGEETEEELINFSMLEKQAIIDSDVIIIILPGGRGTHIELGISLALNKKIYLCSLDGKDFNLDNAVNFYFSHDLTRLVGNIDSCIKEILK